MGFFQKMRDDARKKRDDARTAFLIGFVKEAIKIKAVQCAIADEFSGGTPLCGVLHRAIESEMEGIEVKADDVSGFDSEVEECLERYFSNQNFTLDAEQINDLEEEVEKIMDDRLEKMIEHKMDEIISGVVDAIVEKLR